MIKFDHTVEDFTEYNKYYLKHNAPFFQKYLRYFYLFLILFVLYNFKDILFDERVRKNIDFAPLIPVMVLLPLLVFMFIKRGRGGYSASYSKKFAKKNPQSFGPREIELTEDKLIVKIAGATSEYKYDFFAGLVDEPEYYFVMMSGQMGITIPKRALTDKADEEMLKRKIKPFVKK
jgi:hypothetical protein